MCEDGTRSSSQSRQDQVVGSRKSSATSRRSRSRSRDRRRSRDRVRSTPDKSSSTVRPSRPYAAGLAAQLSQKRKQLEARAKEKLKLEKENLAKLSALGSEDTKVEVIASSPGLKRTNEKVIIEIHDDDDQHMPDCQKVANGLPPVLEEKADNASLKGDDASTSTSDNTPSSSSDTSSTQSDDSKHDAMQTSDSQQTSVDSSAPKSAPAVLSLMNLPMPPGASESDSEVTPTSTAT